MHRVDVQLEDDLTGGPADETIQFSLDGRSYEIDLNSRHAAEFRHKLAPFAEHARPAHARRARASVRTAASRERSRDIRAWAEQHGLAISPHGRLPRTVVQQYDNEHKARQPAERAKPGHAARRTRASRLGARRRRAARIARRPAPERERRERRGRQAGLARPGSALGLPGWPRSVRVRAISFRTRLIASGRGTLATAG